MDSGDFAYHAPPRPGGVWSAWDMLKAHAAAFLKLVSVLQTMERMRDAKTEAREPLFKFVSELLPAVSVFAEEFKWRSVAAQVTRTRALLDQASTDPPAVATALAALRERIEDELNDCLMWFVDPALAPYEQAREMFGLEVAAKLPNSMEDIESAGTCLCLSQATACVFHLMRAMEGAVGALCTSLGIPNPDRVWGQLLSDLDAKIGQMPKGAARTEWSAVRANLYHVKEAWRNDTMHPKQTYTVEQAKEVFEATKVFMRQLAGLI